MSFTVALIIVSWLLSATRVVAPDATSISPTTTAAAFTVTLPVADLPLLWAVAVIVSVPVPSPAVYVTVATPFMLVTAEADPRDAPLALAVSSNATVSPTTTLPFVSTTLALIVDVPSGFTVAGAALTVTVSGGPAANSTWPVAV